ncbi:MAG TPA: acyl-CoA dehydrogenase family protein [Myxococcota bacterium]|jgi:alkylation response protein AidB-like acyl-CoA dehydrogenase
MRFAFTEEQEALRATARAFLAEHSGSEQVRSAMRSDLGFAPELWKQISTELGWPAVCVPEAYGGLGLGAVELAALLEAMGESLLCAPFFSSLCLGANALRVAGSDAQQSELLPAIAEGRALATLAAFEPDKSWSAAGIEAEARREGGDYLLSGRKRFVLDGHCADLLIVAARREGSREGEGISLFAVPSGLKGVERRALATLDQTRRLAEIELHDVRVPVSARLGDEGSGAAALERIRDLAAIALAAEQVGGAQRCLDLAVAHAKTRVQFGRPIGSFQAIQHKCADMMLRVESARSAAYYAACVAAEDGEDLARVASLAKVYCSEAYFQCAADSLQVHGGVGFTWEYDVQLHLKRAKWAEAFLGDPAWHRERVARLIGL